jgi:NAD(P)-dependent dehydrogenase (short-subunit alcohol dehydrogenase family)
MDADLAAAADQTAAEAAFIAASPLAKAAGRMITPEEVAQAIYWLGTSSPDYLSGTTVDVNNGSYPR